MSKEEVAKIFEEHSLDDIVQTYTKRQLTDMFMAVFSSKPLSASNKMRIAQEIRSYFRTVERTKALLG